MRDALLSVTRVATFRPLEMGDATMFQRNFFVVVAVVLILYGLGFVIIPGQLAAWYGNAEISDVARLFGQYLGSSLIGLAIIFFLARDVGPSAVLTGLLWGGLVTNIINLILIFLATNNDVVNAMGWSSVVLHILLGAGFAYLLFGKSATAST